MRDYLRPHCDILAYCLMPNHFHFLINTNGQSVLTKTVGSLEKNVLSEGMRILLSSYTQAINKQENRIGSLFTQNTKCKCLTMSNVQNDYAFTCFGYTHQNPMKAGLVSKMEDWEYSSFRDYAQLRNGTMCNQELAYELIGLNKSNFYQESYRTINDNVLKEIW